MDCMHAMVAAACSVWNVVVNSTPGMLYVQLAQLYMCARRQGGYAGAD
jgi:hypothetical protein